jgi:hypothetical protein
MAFSLIQTNLANGATAAIVATMTATTQNNLIVGSTVAQGTTDAMVSVTDDKLNTYVVQSALTGGFRSYQFYGVQVTGGATVITILWDGVANYHRAIVSEFSGGKTTNATVFDTSTTGGPTAGTTNPTNTSVSTLTPSASGNLIVADVCWDNGYNTWSAGTNYTKAAEYLADNTGIGILFYRLSSGTSETAPGVNNNADATGLHWCERATSFNGPIVTSVGGGFMTTNTLFWG